MFTSIYLKIILTFMVISITPLSVLCAESKSSDYFMSTYGGQISDSNLSEVVFNPQFSNSHIIAIAGGVKLLKKKEKLRLEVEGQAIRHEGQDKYPCDCESCSVNGYHWAEGQSYEKSQKIGTQRHYEFNLVLVLRWLKFPWNHYLKTELAIGEGISYATKIPPIEQSQHAINHGLTHNTSQWLNYLMFELNFALPAYPNTGVFYRIHHRSGDYGLINGVSDGSNFVGLGLRHEF